MAYKIVGIVVEEEKPMNSLVAIVILSSVACFMFFGEEKTPTVTQPHSAFYVSNQGNFKSTLVQGVEYNHYSDDSCSKTESLSRTCLTSEQAEQACSQFEGINTIDTKFDGLNGKNNLTGIRVKMKDGKTLVDQTFNIEGFTRGFVANKCLIKVDVSNEYTDKTKYVAEVTGWKMSPEGKLLATWTSISTAPYWSTKVDFK